MKNLIGWLKWKWIDALSILHGEPRVSTLWIKVWDANKKMYQLIEVSCQRDINSLLKFLGLAKSRSDVERTIKSNGFEFADVWQGDGWQPVKLKQTLPQGTPLWVRKGKALFGIKEFILPRNTDRFPVWRELMRTDWGC